MYYISCTQDSLSLMWLTIYVRASLRSLIMRDVSLKLPQSLVSTPLRFVPDKPLNLSCNLSSSSQALFKLSNSSLTTAKVYLRNALALRLWSLRSLFLLLAPFYISPKITAKSSKPFKKSFRPISRIRLFH